VSELDDKEIIEFFRRSYAGVDGLWFMKVEERYGFDVALEIDEEVWKVLPKIQARAISSSLGKSSGMDALQDCFSVKLRLEGFEFEIENHSGLEITMTRCPWHDRLVKAKREHLAEKIGSQICTGEYSVFASEFGDFELLFTDRICRGSQSCKLKFSPR
jgi:hypothetical protein